jgi:serine phosphatase RsbU (regulator of sigma subunit)
LLLDINGKGLPGVVTMKRVRDTIRESMKSETSPSSTLKKANQIVATWTDNKYFMVCQMVVFNTQNREAELFSCGASPLLFWEKKRNTVESFQPKGIAMGFDEGPKFSKNLEKKVLQLSEGDRLVLYSDGAYEGQSLSAGENDPLEKLKSRVQSYADQSSREFIQNLVKEIEDGLEDPEKPLDDIALVSFRVLS